MLATSHCAFMPRDNLPLFSTGLTKRHPPFCKKSLKTLWPIEKALNPAMMSHVEEGRREKWTLLLKGAQD